MNPGQGEPQHRDLYEIKWSAGERVLVERVPADWRGPWPGGSYRDVSPPHTANECPFKDSDRVPFA